MKYMGSKRRIWKHISPFILENREKSQCYVEPFCGGCNSISNVSGWRIAADVNPYLIAMWKSLLNNEPQYFPIERELFYDAWKSYKEKDNRFTESDLGWIGFMASYNGTFFNSYARISSGRNYIFEGMNNVLKQLDSLRGVIFRCCSYDELVIPRNSIIYCDIPYRNTEKYKTKEFDYEKFYQWCFDKKSEGHKVFISEYWMPNEFDCIWSMKISNSLDRFSEQKIYKTEKLFTI